MPVMPDPSPIFIVGLPRSGSTLVEQILASHSSVEGTFELPNVLTIVREFDHADARTRCLPGNRARRAAASNSALSAGATSRRPRRYAAARPHFIDKMPNNFSHVGLIHAMLPTRDHHRCAPPPDGRLLQHLQAVFRRRPVLQLRPRRPRPLLPLLSEPDGPLGRRCSPAKCCICNTRRWFAIPRRNIRRLLGHCGLEFEPACLAFHETKRPVRTASAEQVRQPLYASGVGYWRHFEPQLEPLRRALGDAPGALRAVGASAAPGLC